MYSFLTLTILLPSVTASYLLLQQTFGGSSHRPVSTWLFQRIHRMVARIRTLVVQCSILPLIVPPQPPSIGPTTGVNDMDDNPSPYNKCPFCHHVPPTMAVQEYCHTCGLSQQMYCYACFYQHFCVDMNNHLFDCDHDEEQDQTQHGSLSHCALTTKSDSFDYIAGTPITTTGRTLHVPNRHFYRFPMRKEPRNVRSFFPHSVNCDATIDMVAFVHHK